MQCFEFWIFFVLRCHITHKNFLSDWTNSCTVIVLIFFRQQYFVKREKNWKNSYGFWKMNKLIWNSLKTFRHYSYTIGFDIFNMSDFFQIFFISRRTEILIELNFWLWLYYILKESVSLHSQQKVGFKEYFEYFLMA